MRLVKGILIGLGVLVVIGAVIGMFEPDVPEPTERARINTTNNAGRAQFVDGCVEEGGVTVSECGCAYDRLLGLYPDFATNQERLNRVITEGYNESETRVMSACWQNVETI